jgi:hypothetical protein
VAIPREIWNLPGNFVCATGSVEWTAVVLPAMPPRIQRGRDTSSKMRTITQTVPKGSAIEEFLEMATKFNNVATTKKGPRYKK